MILKVKRPELEDPTKPNTSYYILKETDIDNLNINEYAILSIDGSTSNTGMAILRERDGALFNTLTATREEKSESPVHYKIRLKRAVVDLLRKNPKIVGIYYEEPCIGYAGAVSNLFMLRAFIEELIIENEPEFNHIKHFEINNMKWKKKFLAPDKVPVGSENQKKAVRDKMLTLLPFMLNATQDEIDAVAMGYSCCRFLADGNDSSELKSKKAVRKFQYNIDFIGANTDDDMFMEFQDIYKGPSSILENGVKLEEVDFKTNFEKAVYNAMGEDDKLLIMKFESKHHANLVLQYRIGNLAAQYEYLYAMVWRKTRKYN